MHILKKEVSEDDIKLNYFTPTIQPGWTGHIMMETKITDGLINNWEIWLLAVSPNMQIICCI